jgi:hypothetical protein
LESWVKRGGGRVSPWMKVEKGCFGSRASCQCMEDRLDGHLAAKGNTLTLTRDEGMEVSFPKVLPVKEIGRMEEGGSDLSKGMDDEEEKERGGGDFGSGVSVGAEFAFTIPPYSPQQGVKTFIKHDSSPILHTVWLDSHALT